MARVQDSTIRLIMLALIVVLIFYMILSFGGTDSFSTVDITGKQEVSVGEEVEYEIDLLTVNPAQFETALHYREQYGRWRIESANGTELSPGRQTKILGGRYNQIVTINIPPGNKEIYFIAEIVEYQYSAADPEGPFIRDNGTIRVRQKLQIDIKECTKHADCTSEDLCLGQFGYCTEGLCEIQGACVECVSNSDCADLTEADPDKEYECIDFQCFEYEEPTSVEKFQTQIKETFDQPITEPAPVETGQPPEPKQATTLLSLGVFLMVLLVSYLVLKKKGKI